MKCCVFSADRPDHLMLFRTFVSRNAATNGRAVLEGVWLDSFAIDACFNNANSEEAAVQAGLVKWKDGHSRQPPTWEVLLMAMDYAKIAQQHIQALRKELALDWYVVALDGSCVSTLKVCMLYGVQECANVLLIGEYVSYLKES